MAEGNKKWGFTAGPKPQENALSELAGEHGFKVENFFRINEVSGQSGQPGLSPEEFMRMFLECPSELRNVLAGNSQQQQESSEPSDVSTEETDSKQKTRRRRMKKRQEKETKEEEEKGKEGEKATSLANSLDAQLKDMNLKSDDKNGHGDGKSKGEKSVEK